MRFRYARALLLGGLLATLAAAFVGRAVLPSREQAAGDQAPPVAIVSPASSTWPLLCAIAAIVTIGALWLGGQAWSEARQAAAVARAITGGDPTKAAALVTRYGCGGCHSIPGLPGADGQVAPSLSDIRKRVYIGGVLLNTAPNMLDWIVDPQAHSPRSAMPVTGISRSEARDVAAYLYAH